MRHLTADGFLRSTVLLLGLLVSSLRLDAGVVWVTSNANSGTGSLRQAITDANAVPGSDSVIFDLSGPVFEIGLLSPLPFITEGLIIDGSSQPGASLPFNPVVLKGVGVVSFGIQFSTGGVHLRNLKFENFMNQPWYSNSTAVLCDPGFFFQGMISDVSVSGNIFINNHQAIRFSHFDSLQNIRFTGNWFEGNFLSVNIYEQDGYAFDLVFTGNTVDDTTGFGVGSKKCTGLVISNNSFSCSATAISLTGTRLSNSTLNNNSFSETNPSSEGVSVQVYRIKYLRIRDNVFDGLYNSVYIRTSGTSGIALELQHVFILNNVFRHIRGTAIYLNGGGTGGIQLDANDIQVSGNNIVSALSGGNGISLFVSGTGGALFEYENVRIHDNSISGQAEISSGISISLMAEVNLHDLLIQNNYIDSCTNAGIYLYGAGAGNGNNSMREITIRQNTITGIANMGIVMTAPGACVSSVFRNAVIDSNSVSACGQHAFRLYGTGNSNAVFDSIFIFRNSFFSNGSNGIDLVHFGTIMTGIKMLENTVYNNGGAGMYLSQTPLVYGNPYIPPPVIDSVVVSGNVTSVYGTVSVPYSNRDFAVELFASTTPDPSGFGEGEYFLLRDTFLTDSSGIALFSFTVPVSSAAGFYTATATDLFVGCTSVFSNVVGSISSDISSFENTGIRIFPVPVTDYLIVEGMSGSPADMVIYDASGKITGSHRITTSYQKINFPYTTGMFFYQIIQQGRVVFAGKGLKVPY